jgi:hypothetical protein
MKKTYQSPQVTIIQLRAEQHILTGSVWQDSTPVPNALEGDTDPWGEWM